MVNGRPSSPTALAFPLPKVSSTVICKIFGVTHSCFSWAGTKSLRSAEVISQAAGSRRTIPAPPPICRTFQHPPRNRQAPQHSYTTAPQDPRALSGVGNGTQHPSRAATTPRLPTKDAADLQQTLQHLKATQHLNLSAFCRAAIAEKLQRHLQQEIK